MRALQPTDLARSKSFVPPAFSSARPTLDKHRVAVLPLQNISPDPKDEYFADGMTEELISTLSKISGLKVIARTSVMGYKGGEKKIDEIARELRVGTILEGSVRKAGDKLRITVQLIDSESSDHLWSENYDRKLDDVFAIQSDIAGKAEALKVKLLGSEERRIEKKATENLEAYQLYLQGRYFWNKRTKEGLMKGIEYFEQAIRKDPNYALAYAGLAECYSILGNNGLLPPKEVYPQAKVAAMRALELDDKLAEVQTALAFVKYHDFDFSGAEKGIKQAIELNPSFATAHYYYADFLLWIVGRTDEGIAEHKRAQELDPLSLIVSAGLGGALYLARRYDEAVEQLQKTLEMDQNFAVAHTCLGFAYLQKSMFEQAVTEFRKASNLSGLAYAYALSGKKDDAVETLEELRKASKEGYVSPNEFALVYVGLGQKDEAFEWLEKAIDDLSPDFSLRVDPVYDSLRSDTRYLRLLQKVGLSVVVSK